MARTSNIYVRVEPEIKEQAENVLEQLGIPMSNAISVFLRQIVLQKGIPFEMLMVPFFVVSSAPIMIPPVDLFCITSVKLILSEYNSSHYIIHHFCLSVKSFADNKYVG